MQEIYTKSIHEFSKHLNKISNNLKVVIIAAGKGTRLQPFTNYKPKCLVKILESSIIERVLKSVKETGLTDIIIVTGYKGEIIKSEIGNGEKYGVSIQYINNSDWEKGNATSVYSVRDSVGDDFILLMSDHLFDTQNLKKLINFPLINDNCLLATDSNMDHIYDIQDATKVYLDNSLILNIGKDLLNYNTIDTGMFRFARSIFDALEKSFIENKYNLSDAIGYLIKYQLMYGIDIGNKFWQDIDTQVDLQNVEKRLLMKQEL